jgi:hypothetical protein
VKTYEECRDWMDSANVLTRPVSDVIMDDRYQCRFDGCIHAVKDRATARQHVQEHNADPDMYLLDVKVQKVFNSNLRKYCVVEAVDTGIDETTEVGWMLAAFRRQAKELLPKPSPIGVFSRY